MKTLSTTEIKRLNRDWRRRTEGRLVLALVSLSNPFNVGSILRSAAVFGVDLAYLVGATPGPDEAKVHKTGLGTERAVETRRVDSLAEVVATLAPNGFQTVALELASEAEPIGSYEFGLDVCLVIGNEGHGLPPSALASCDAAVYIPQVGKVASLNVAAATSIAMYEIRRQSWARSTST